MSVSLSVSLSLNSPKRLTLICWNLRDNFPWEANGFRQRNIRIWPTFCQKTKKTQTILATINLRLSNFRSEEVGSKLGRWCYRKSLQSCTGAATSLLIKAARKPEKQEEHNFSISYKLLVDNNFQIRIFYFKFCILTPLWVECKSDYKTTMIN